METGEKIVNRYTEKPVKAKNGFAMLALILLLLLGSIAVAVCGPVLSALPTRAWRWPWWCWGYWCLSSTCSSWRA